MTQTSGKEYQIGLAMAGAISAGAYSAGVFDFLVQALDQWESNRGSAVPNHRTGIKVISGASAGAITGAVGAIALADGLRPTPFPAGTVKAGKQRFRCVLPSLHTTWVELPRMVGGDCDLLSDQDLKAADAGAGPQTGTQPAGPADGQLREQRCTPRTDSHAHGVP